MYTCVDYLHTKCKRHNSYGSWQSDTKLNTCGELHVLVCTSTPKSPKQNKHNFDSVLSIILLSSRALYRLVWQKCTDVSEESVFCNVGTLLRDLTASYRRTEHSLIVTSVRTLRLTQYQHIGSANEIVLFWCHQLCSLHCRHTETVDDWNLKLKIRKPQIPNPESYKFSLKSANSFKSCLLKRINT
jgi:hypothetical protein